MERLLIVVSIVPDDNKPIVSTEWTTSLYFSSGKDEYREMLHLNRLENYSTRMIAMCSKMYLYIKPTSL